MAVYSIKDLEKLTGIKAHTIRIWEQRYCLIEPKRTKTNIRYYCDADLKKLINIALLNRQGVKISKLATMTPQEIAEQASMISECNLEYDTQLDTLTIAMIEMDDYKFDHVLSANIDKMGFEQTMLSVVYPFLERLNLLWLTGSVSPVQEYFMSNLLRQKVIAAIDREPIVSPKERDAKRFMIYLPEGERQELSLLFMYFLLKTRHHHVIYLGNEVSWDDLKDAYQIRKPDYIFTFINEPFLKISTQQYVNNLATAFSDCQILLSGYQVSSKELKLCSNVSICHSLDDTIHFIDTLQSPAFYAQL
ncbi:MAG: MerR family transcriptional regulator [Saprospiraceae bacterium]|nr:MerR family transcriptional regulator [Saprospiraceae bacterium]